MQTAVTTAVVAMATDKSTTIVAPATATLKMISKPGLNTSSGSEWTKRQEDLNMQVKLCIHLEMLWHMSIT